MDFQQSASVDWLIDDRWALYAEWFAAFPSGADTTHSVGPGISYMITHDVQLDLVTSFGVDAWSTDLITQLLVTWRR